MKGRIEKIIEGRNFNEMLEIFKRIPVDRSGSMIRKHIMEVMEEKYPVEFNQWVEEY